MINQQYGFYFPERMLGKLASLPENYFDYSNGQKIIDISLKRSNHIG
jgi:hypothetical protein